MVTPLNLSYEMAEAHIKGMAEALVRDAVLYGVVLTIEQLPVPPLAMGRHHTKVYVRPARELAKPTTQGWSDE